MNRAAPLKPGAGNESRTRDLNLGKVALYQLSYSRIEEDVIIGMFPENARPCTQGLINAQPCRYTTCVWVYSYSPCLPSAPPRPDLRTPA